METTLCASDAQLQPFRPLTVHFFSSLQRLTGQIIGGLLHKLFIYVTVPPDMVIGKTHTVTGLYCS